MKTSVLNGVLLGLLPAFLQAAPMQAEKVTSPTGIDTCTSGTEPSGMYEPFGKDPTAFEFGSVTYGDHRWIVVVDLVEGKHCGRIRAALELTDPIPEGQGVGFNCMPLDQVYNRYKSYMAVFQAGTTEVSRAERAWVFDFATNSFTPYAKPENVYCENFIAD